MRPIDADALKEDLTRFYAGEVTARDLIDEQPTIGGWISVKDRMPESGCDVLAYYNHPVESRVVPVNYYNDIWFDCVFNRPIDIDIDYITHWMPLPEPPEET